MGGGIGPKQADVLHLDHQQQIGLIARLHGPAQLAQVLYAALGRRVGKQRHAVFLQRNALYLHKRLAPAVLHIEIEAGIPEFHLTADDGAVTEQAAYGQPLTGGVIGRLRIHVDPQRRSALPLFFHGDKVILGFAARLVRSGQVHRTAAHQKLPTPSGVLHMDGFLRAVDQDPGNEAVGAA